MKPKIREDTRTWGEFYPDPALRHQVHHVFAPRFLPAYAHEIPFAFFSCLYRAGLIGIPHVEPRARSMTPKVDEPGHIQIAMASGSIDTSPAPASALASELPKEEIKPW